MEEKEEDYFTYPDGFRDGQGNISEMLIRALRDYKKRNGDFSKLDKKFLEMIKNTLSVGYTNINLFIEDSKKVNELDFDSFFEEMAAFESIGNDDENDMQYYKVGREAESFYYEFKFWADKNRLSRIDDNNAMKLYCDKNLEPNEIRKSDKMQLPIDFNKEIQKILIKKFPEKCPNCGFSKFMEINLTSISMGLTVILTCPRCRIKVMDLREHEKW